MAASVAVTAAATTASHTHTSNLGVCTVNADIWMQCHLLTRFSVWLKNEVRNWRKTPNFHFQRSKCERKNNKLFFFQFFLSLFLEIRKVLALFLSRTLEYIKKSFASACSYFNLFCRRSTVADAAAVVAVAAHFVAFLNVPHQFQGHNFRNFRFRIKVCCSRCHCIWT